VALEQRHFCAFELQGSQTLVQDFVGLGQLFDLGVRLVALQLHALVLLLDCGQAMLQDSTVVCLECKGARQIEVFLSDRMHFREQLRYKLVLQLDRPFLAPPKELLA